MPIAARGIAQRGISLARGIATRGISVSERQCWAYNFDGIDDRGVLTNRAINIEGDNSLEFWSPAGATGGMIIAQNISATESAREFNLWRGGSGELNVTFGGVTSNLMTVAQGFKAQTRYGLTLIGTEAKIYEVGLSGTLVRTTTFTRGAAREPTAQTLIGCRGAGAGAYANFFSGLQYDIKINGTLWEMGDRNQSIQLPTPTGLGAELITQSVLENPATKGTQWTYLGGGRWQYIGDGSLNDLIFISFASQPAAGFLEFEIESISGTLTCAQGGASVPSQFNTVGVKRYYYTTKDNGANVNANCVSFKRASGVASCIIKNISFKPLGTCNPMQLINTTSDRWQAVPCRVNTEGVQVQGGAFITTSDNKKVEVLK